MLEGDGGVLVRLAALILALPFHVFAAEMECKIDQWKWTRLLGGSAAIEGVLETKNVGAIYVHAYRDNGAYLGQGLDYPDPGGGFMVLISGAPPKGEPINIKYTCTY